MLDVKICGLTTPEAVDAAVAGGARYLGFVFYPPSPRHLGTEAAMQLARRLPTGVRGVALFVDPSDSDLRAVLDRVPLDMIQLHGREDPARVAAIRQATGQPVIKAVRVATTADLEAARSHQQAADMILFDAKAPANVTSLPGGNGLAFDWTILSGLRLERPWMLSGGLKADTLAEAVATTGARAVDVSSGVETRPGHKDPALIRQFLQTARGL